MTKRSASSAPVARPDEKRSTTKRADGSKYPTKEELKDVPQVDFSKAEAEWGRGPEALKRVLAELRARRQGRIANGAVAVPVGTSVRSIRFANTVWASVDATAKKRGITPHALIRQAIAKELATGRKRKKAAKAA